MASHEGQLNYESHSCWVKGIVNGLTHAYDDLMNEPQAASMVQRPGRGGILLGFALAVLGVATYVVQFNLHRFSVPWYLPITGTLASLLLFGSLLRRRSLWRVLAFVLVLALAAGEWGFILMTRLPAYTGPVAVGKPFPAFSTLRADGTPFTERDLGGDQNTVFVFFRGRW